MSSLARFSVDDLELFGRAIRALGDGANGMPHAARRITEHLAANLRCDDGRPSSVAVTLHISQRFDQLPPDLREAAAAEGEVTDATPCLALLASSTTADEAKPQRGVMPLTDVAYAERPILLSMLSAMGLNRQLLADPSAVVLSGLHRSELDAFVVRDLPTSELVGRSERPLIAALGIRTLLTIGGGLPTGDVFLLSIFSLDEVSDRSAWVFRAIAPAVKAALIPHALHPWQHG